MNHFIKALIVLFVIGNLLDASTKRTIAVMDINTENFTEKESNIIRNRIETELIDLDLFRVVDRKNVDLILKEQGFQLSGCTSEECAVEIGQLLSVEDIFLCSISEIDSLFIIQMKITDVESGQISQSISYDFKGSTTELITIGLKNCIMELFSLEHPLVKNLSKKGYLQLIVQPSDAEIMINDSVYAHDKVKNTELMPGLYKINISSKYYYPYSKDIQISQNLLLPLNVRLSSAKDDYRSLKFQSDFSITLSTLSFLSTLACTVIANNQYKKYENAASIDDAIYYRKSFQRFDKLTAASLSIATISTTFSIYKFCKLKKLKHEIGL